MKSRRFWAAALVVHFAFIATVSCSDILDLVAGSHTMLPRPLVSLAQQSAQIMQSLSLRQLARRNPLRQTVLGYAHMAGVESPYTFFAPNIPDSLRVIFELEFPDKHVVHDIPHVRSHSEGLRLSALVDQAAARPGLWRDVVLQMLAASAAAQNPDATRIRVVVAARRFPRPNDYLTGAEATYDLVCSYQTENADQPSDPK